MSDVETVDTGGTVFDDPNRQAVGLEPAWVEGTGGTPAEPEPPQNGEGGDGGNELDSMTKEQLLERGQQLGITPMNAGMTKEEIRAAIDNHLAGG